MTILQPLKKNPAEIYFIEIVSRKIIKLIDGGVNTYRVVSGWGIDRFRRMLSESTSEVFLSSPTPTAVRPKFDQRSLVFDGLACVVA